MQIQQKKNIVVVGGGTGIHALLRALKKHRDQLEISAVVTMADSGGSTGRLRDEFGYLPVGDVRNALVALASERGEHADVLRELFLYRFAKGEGLNGHNFGNLLLTALTDILGSEEEAIAAAADILRIAGRVIPVTTDDVNLLATYDDGVTVLGEHLIDEPHEDRTGHCIVALDLEPAGQINPAAAAALAAADLVVFGPGDFFTSLMANCAVTGFAESLNPEGKLMYIANLMNRWGQTEGMTVCDYLDYLQNQLGRPLDYCLVNDEPLPEDLLMRYQIEGDYPVVFCTRSQRGVGGNRHTAIFRGDFLTNEKIITSSGDQVRRSFIRHDGGKLVEAIMMIFNSINLN